MLAYFCKLSSYWCVFFFYFLHWRIFKWFQWHNLCLRADRNRENFYGGGERSTIWRQGTCSKVLHNRNTINMLDPICFSFSFALAYLLFTSTDSFMIWDPTWATVIDSDFQPKCSNKIPGPFISTWPYLIHNRSIPYPDLVKRLWPNLLRTPLSTWVYLHSK